MGLAEALKRGIALLQQGQRDDAETFFLAILQASPAHPDARHFLGVLRFQQGRADEALELLNGVLRTHAASPALLSNLGLVLHALGRFGESLQCLDRALALDPDSAAAHHNRGNALKELGRREEALASYDRAIALRPGYAEAFHGRATVLMEQGQWGEVERSLRACIALAPGYADAQISLGLLLLQVGRDAEALDQARAALTLERGGDFPHHNFGVLLARCGLVPQAQAQLRAALARDKEDRLGARLLLAGLGGEPLPDRVSPAFVDRLYGKRAADWDRAMVEGRYSGAALVAEALAEVAGDDAQLDILDAGCGTGLVGVLLRERARTLDGVDASAQMLAASAAKGVYRQLHEGDLVDFLAGRPQAYDAVTCAATLIHFGDLRPPLQAAATALRGGGWMVFTLFANERGDEPYQAGTFDGYAQGGCYVHSAGHVRSAADAAGFDVAVLRQAVHEYHYDKAKMGMVAALRKRAG